MAMYETSTCRPERADFATGPSSAPVCRLQALAELGQRLLTARDLSCVFDQALGTLTNALPVEYAKVLCLLPGGKALKLKWGLGWKSGYVQNAIVEASTQSQAGYTLAVRKPVVVHNFRFESRFAAPELLRAHDVMSGISVILPTASGPFGVLGIHSRRPRAFAPADVALLQCVSNILAVIISCDPSVVAANQKNGAGSEPLKVPVDGLHGSCEQRYGERVLNSWKEIAQYLNRAVRTAQRWERDLQMPVHRPRGKPRSAAVALTSELDFWLQQTPLRS